jgi:two-component system sensor histidine kinase RegB
MQSREEIKLKWLVRVRWAAMAAWAIIALCTGAFLSLDLPLTPLLVFLAITALSNVALLALPSLQRGALLRAAGVVLSIDIILLSGLLYCYGGYANPFSMMFLVYVTLAAFFLNGAWTWWSFALSSLGFVLLFFFHIPIAGMDAHHHSGGGDFSLHLHGMLFAFLIIGSLVSVFLTKMSDALEIQATQLALFEKRKGLEDNFISVATLAAGAAHELSTPIATMSLIADDMCRDLQSDTRWNGDVSLLSEQLARCTRILESMRGQSAEINREVITEISVSDLVSTIRAGFPEANIQFSFDEGVFTCFSRALIEALRSLVKNALQASGVAAIINFNIELSPEFVRFLIVDTGSGMTEDVAARVGEPFFTTKSPGNGLGLGVFLVRLFAQRIGGELTIDSAKLRGTSVTLTIPRRGAV